MRFIERNRSLAVVATLATAICATVAQPVRGEVIDRIVATIDGDPITQYEVKEFAAGDIRLHQLGLSDPNALLEALITKRLIDKEFDSQGLKVEDEDIDRYVAGIRQRNNLTPEQLEAALQQQGMTMEAYRTQVRDELRRAQLINREIRGKVNVTPEEVQRYYEAHLDEYSTPSEVEISHILLQLPPDAPAEQVEQVEKRADAIYQQLQNGADFAALAKQDSEDTASAASGGKLGTFKKGEMLEALEKAIEGLKPGEFSKPVRSPVGIHIVRLDKRISESHQSLDNLADEIKQRLYNAALEERYNRWLREDLRQRHHVELRP
jgi:peptidyl-prolyl cis-trans isomerase SurA